MCVMKKFDSSKIEYKSVSDLTWSNFPQFKYVVQHQRYDGSIAYNWERFNLRYAYANDSKLTTSTNYYNCSDSAFSFDFPAYTHSPECFTLTINNNDYPYTIKNKVLKTALNGHGILSVSNAGCLTMQDIESLHDTDPFIPASANHQVRVKMYEDCGLYYSSRLYLGNVSNSYPNNGKGWIVPMLGKSAPVVKGGDYANADNAIYQKVAVIDMTLQPNTTYYCKHLYPLQGYYYNGSSDDTFSMGMNGVSTTSPYAPSYGKMSTSCIGIATTSTTTAFTAPTAGTSKRYSVSLSEKMSPKVQAMSANNSDLVVLHRSSISGFINYENAMCNTNTQYIENYPATFRAGLDLPVATGYENHTYQLPAIKSFKTGQNGARRYLMCVARYSLNGVDYTPIPDIYY